MPLLAAAGRPEALTLAPPPDAPVPVRLGVLYERAAALEKRERYAEARAALRAAALELPVLLTDDVFVGDLLRLHAAEDEYGDAFADGSPFKDAEVASDLVERLASMDVVRWVAGRQDAAGEVARQEVLFRLLRDRQWADFLAFYEQAGKPAPFDEVETAARSLAADAADPKGLFNVGYFLHRRNGASGDCCPCEDLPSPPPAVTSGGVSPIALYAEAIDQLRASPDESLEPRVLHHAILCFKESSDAAACQRGAFDPVPESTRAEWFRRLKTRYPRSPWSARTPYYY